jgi:carbamoyl-phosphate synthase large subunit
MNQVSVRNQLTEVLRKAKSFGFSDRQIAFLVNRAAGEKRYSEGDIRRLRYDLGIEAVFKAVDTCAGEFEAYTPYYYSTYERENESQRSDRPKVVILGGGPNRIGQGIEFDYCCVHAVFALREEGFEAIMVNSNPETVSTDYDTSDKLYFEPLTVEDVLNILRVEQPDGVIVQFGGQTPLSIAVPLERAIAEDPRLRGRVKILGTSPDSIDLAEDRKRFGALLAELDIPQPPNATGMSVEEVIAAADQLGLPVLVRPSYVLGGRAMVIVRDRNQLGRFATAALRVSPEHPVLIDKFLEDATEIDVDALADGERVVIAAIMEHIEEAGIHSGDSACVIPPRTLSDEVLEKVRRYTHQIGRALNVRGLMNIQYAAKGNDIYVLEVNPRASRTVPFVSKAIGAPIAKLAAKIMVGRTLEQLGFTDEIRPPYYSVKEVVLPFARFPGCDILLGPEMRSTGEVMGIDPNFGVAFFKSQVAAGGALPLEGSIFISINDADKPKFLPVAKRFHEMGFKMYATNGTHRYLAQHGVATERVCKIAEGRPNVLDLMINDQVQLVINTAIGSVSETDTKAIRSNAVARGVPLITTVAAARAAVEGIAAARGQAFSVAALQDHHKQARIGKAVS